MSDAHLRILEMVARYNQRRLDEHDAVEGAAAAGSAERRDLETRATRTRARVAAARARRRDAPKA